METTCGSQARASGDRGLGCAEGAETIGEHKTGKCHGRGGGGTVRVRGVKAAESVVGVGATLAPPVNRQAIAQNAVRPQTRPVEGESVNLRPQLVGYSTQRR